MPTKNLVSNVQPAVNLGASLFLDRKMDGEVSEKGIGVSFLAPGVVGVVGYRRRARLQ